MLNVEGDEVPEGHPILLILLPEFEFDDENHDELFKDVELLLLLEFELLLLAF